MWQHSGAQGHAMWLQPGRGDAVAYTPLKNPIKKRKKEMVFIHGMTWTYICVRPWITLFLMLVYCTHRHACTPNTTITTTSVNFKKLKGDWGNMSLTHVFWEMCAFSVQTPLWPFHTWFETPINSRVSLSEKYPISCRCHVVGCLSAKFLLRHEVTARLYQNRRVCRRDSVGSAMDGVTVTCDIISESWSFQTDEEGEIWLNTGLWKEITHGDCEMCRLLIRLRAE